MGTDLVGGKAHANARLRIGLLNRALWHLNRTGVAWLLKGVLSAVHVRNKRIRRRFARGLRVDAGIAGRAEQLRQEGWAMVGDLVDQQLLREMAAVADELRVRADSLAEAQLHTHKSFWVRLLDEQLANSGGFAVDSPLVRFAIQSPIVQLLAARLGEIPRLVDVLLTLSRHVQGPHTYSQLWHRDYDDVATIKLFVYLTDVMDSKDGPFTFLPRAVSRRVGFTLHSHLSDGAVSGRVQLSAAHEVCGPRLTAFVCETSRCLHTGSRLAPGHWRLMYTATFITAPRLYPEPPPRFFLSGETGELERLLLRA
jgi:hypothetical protein